MKNKKRSKNWSSPDFSILYSRLFLMIHLSTFELIEIHLSIRYDLNDGKGKITITGNFVFIRIELE